ncbi:MAG: penicillin-binding transpeptidase domain-containing protein [Paludibacter sp.]|nr:penicillin-binding transpeptidase domain-containing protein [Paludibacter sp.]
MTDKGKQILLRFVIVYFLIGCAFAAVFFKTLYIQTAERKPLIKLAQKIQNLNDTSEINYTRGNIYASDGRLLSASIPYYYIRMDTQVGGLKDTGDFISRSGKKDTVIVFKQNGKTVNRFIAKLDSTAAELADLFKDRSKDIYKTDMLNAYSKKSSAFLLYPRRVSYAQWVKVKNMPLFREGMRNGYNLGGLYADTRESLENREKPFGSLAARTLGSVYSENQYEIDKITGKQVIKHEKGSGQNGLEKFFDRYLTGKSGIAVRKKIANKIRETTQIESVAGNDIYTTIDIDIQDLAESALRQNLDTLRAESACAIVMTTDGQIKACVNLFKTANGYTESNDMATQGRYDFGSTFKIVSMMIALENGFIHANDTIITDKSLYGVSDMHAYPYLTASQIIARSSNVGISNIITKNYTDNPQKFIDEIYSMHILDSMKIQIADAVLPAVYRNRTASKSVQISNIARISFGQSIVAPPIYTLRFYNAIANGGQMIEPSLVRYIISNGEIVKMYQKEIINPKICSDNTLKTIREMLEGVVTDKHGTGYPNVRSNIVKIAGKTGTADIANNTKNYASFCGYFPADSPKYTCIVAMVVPHGTYGAGAAGSVFKKIAEGITTMRLNTTPQQIVADSTFVFKMPNIKNGNFEQLQIIAKKLKLPLAGNNSQWITAETDSSKIITQPLLMAANNVPNVYGMGAKDAVYLIELYGMKVNISGRGKVIKQSIPPETKVIKGATIVLTLE